MSVLWSGGAMRERRERVARHRDEVRRRVSGTKGRWEGGRYGD